MTYQPSWQSRDKRMNQVPMRFISKVRPRGFPLEVLASVVSFSGVGTWSGDLLEGNISAIDTPVYEDIEEVSSFVVIVSSSLDVPFWCSSGVLRQDADHLVSHAWHEAFVLVEEEEVPRRTCLHWILHPLCGSTFPRVFACWIYLVGLTLIWQQCFKRVFQFGSTFLWREMRPRGGFHHAILHYRCGDTLNCCQGWLFKDINGLCHQTLHYWGCKTLRELVLLI